MSFGSCAQIKKKISATRIRTGDPRIYSPPLCRLSYGERERFLCAKNSTKWVTPCVYYSIYNFLLFFCVVGLSVFSDFMAGRRGVKGLWNFNRGNSSAMPERSFQSAPNK